MFVFAAFFLSTLLYIGFQTLSVMMLLSLIIFFALVIVAFAVVSQAPGLTEDEKRQKPPVKEEDEVSESPPVMICCVGVLVVSILAYVFIYLEGVILLSGPMMSSTIAMIILLFMGTVCYIAINRIEEQEEKPVSASPKSHVDTRRRIREKQVEKRTTQQRFWHTEGDRRPKSRLPRVSSKVRAARGGEIIGGRFRFKVKVLNESKFTINDVTVYILSYPRDTLLLKTEDDDVFFSKIEPNGFRSPTFDFLPTQDCVRGVITAGVSYVDASGKAHTLTTEPFTIRAVCDLLQPEAISPEGFELKLKGLESGEIILKVEEWTPSEMQEKTLRVLSDSNFHEVSSEESESDRVVHYKVSGWARGKYTGKNVGVEIFISGEPDKKGASCTIRVAGEDDAMILPAIDDLKDRLSAYLCPMCGSKLTLENVKELKKGKVVCCPFCDVSIGR